MIRTASEQTVPSELIAVRDGQPTMMPGATRPDFTTLHARIQALVPTLRERAAQTERDRRVSTDVTQMLRDTELFRLMQPARFGGFEYGFSELMTLSMEIGSGCTSTAWSAGLGVVHQWLAGLFPLEAQQEIWANPHHLLAGSYAPVGKVTPVPGGYRLAGKWSWLSNCDNSDWYLLGVTFPPAEDGARPMPGFVLVPRRECVIEDDWFMAGLAGTGSKSVVIPQEVFVPNYRKITFAEASGNNPPGAAVNTAPIYRVPFLAAVPVTLASPALGALQGAIDQYIENVGGRTTRGAVTGGGNPMRDLAHVQTRIGDASAALDAARLLLARDLADVEETVAAGDSVSVAKRIRNRRDHAYALKLAKGGIDSLFEAVGGAGLHLDHGIQRAWRDIHAIGHHITFSWDWVSSMYGQYQLGLEPRGQY
ncbi:MAG: acyl-CoA dehydrogenase family protein [Burkholderiales bacterium]